MLYATVIFGETAKKRGFSVFALSTEEAEFKTYARRNGRMTVPKEVRDSLNVDVSILVKCKMEKRKL